MDIEVMVALEEMRPVVAFEPDWREVLDRAGPFGRPARPPRRSRLLVPAFAAVAAIVVATTPALGLDGKLASFFDLSRSANVRQTWQDAGPRIHPTPAILAAAKLTHVDRATLRRVSAGGSGYRRVVLLGGIGPDGTAWLGQAGSGWVSNFFPLFGSVGQQGSYVWHTKTAHGWLGMLFPLYDRSDGNRQQVFSYVAYGGDQASQVGWATVVGFVRSDVTRLEIRTAGGATRRVQLSADGGFSYAAVRQADLPRTVHAYDVKGRQVGSAGLELKTTSA